LKTCVWLILCLVPGLFAMDCRLKIDKLQSQYLVGYGSLMNSASARRTSKFLGKELPIWLRGYQRGFYLNSSKMKMATLSATFLSIVPARSSRLNGVAIKLTKADAIYSFDRRERAYCRVNVKRQIKSYTGAALPAGQYWAYVGAKEYFPSEKYPIVQSYVDLFVSGCLRIQQQYKLPDFASQCVRTTSGWSRHWVNDRIFPRRPWIYQPKAFEIDRLLKKNVPAQFSHIRIE
jgi:cation transport regulator ChaC